ncbi:MAG: glycosyltransferase [Dehalococcoidales bacterium]|nr:glycosyltransferase [Dehalococcoidales bacterium]
MDKLPISIVVTTRNSEKTIGQCLESVKNNNPAEIILVDGNSNDDTLEIARRYTSLIFSDEGREYNYAQQLGAEKAANDYIAFVDSDIVLPEGTLAKLLDELKALDCATMAATVLPISSTTYWERTTDWNARLLRKRRGVGGLQATIVLRDVVMNHKLDSSLKGASDLDFTIRMKEAGLKQGVSSVFVYHHHRTSFTAFFRQRFRYGWVAARYVRKYGPFHARFWPPLVTAYWTGICIVKGKPNYIPYFVVDGFAQSCGMAKGFYQLALEFIKRK